LQIPQSKTTCDCKQLQLLVANGAFQILEMYGLTGKRVNLFMMDECNENLIGELICVLNSRYETFTNC
jgi:hypothetical protein